MGTHLGVEPFGETRRKSSQDGQGTPRLLYQEACGDGRKATAAPLQARHNSYYGRAMYKTSSQSHS